MMTVVVMCMAAGNVLGGALGDWLFTRTRRGRLLICLVGVLVGIIALLITIRVPPERPWLFAGMLCVVGLFIPLLRSKCDCHRPRYYPAGGAQYRAGNPVIY